MQPETFFDEVAAASGSEDRAKVEAIALSVIETICIYLPAEQTRKLASQLPRQLAKAAEDGARQGLQNEGGVGVDEFFSQVAQRAEYPPGEVQTIARAALREFKLALSRGETVDVVLDAPPELDALLTD